MAPFAAKKTRHRVWPIAEFLRHFLYALLRRRRDVPRQRRIIQHDRNRGRREATGLRNIPHRDGLVLSALPFHRNERLRGHDHHPSTVAHDAMGSSEPDASFRRHLKREWLAETACLPNAERDAEDHPDAPQDFRWHAKTPPQSKANEESQNRREEVRKLFLRPAEEVVHESGCI